MSKGNTGNSAAAKAATEKAAAKAATEKAATEKAAAEKAAAEKAAAEKAAAEKDAATKQGASAKTIKVPALSVTSSREGFRRAGRAWSKEATVVKLSDLNEEQIAQIKGEAMLTVAEVEVEEAVAE